MLLLSNHSASARTGRAEVSVVREWLSRGGVFLCSDGGARTLMAHHANRPTKICVVCGRPFQWRKKWKTVWEEVTYCSERCRGQRHLPTLTVSKGKG